jgi:hypothetical protein
MKRAAAALAAVVMTAMLGTTAAQAAPATPELEAQVAAQLAKAPGGVRTAVNKVSYDGGAFVVTFAMPGTAKAALASPDCPAGSFCFYDGVNYTYPRGELWACGWQDLGAWGWNDRIESVDNSTGNWVFYKNHFDDGKPSNGHVLDQDLWSNLPYEFIASVPNRNMADHVDRSC